MVFPWKSLKLLFCNLVMQLSYMVVGLTVSVNSKYFRDFLGISEVQKQPVRAILRKRYSENIQQIYREHPCQIVISVKLLCNFIEITFRHRCSRVNLLNIFRTPFYNNTSRGLLLEVPKMLRLRSYANPKGNWYMQFLVRIIQFRFFYGKNKSY